LASNLSERLRPSDKHATSGTIKHYSKNSAAYDAYLKGRYEWSNGSRESLNKAIHYFNDAVRFDPSYAPAFADLANTYSDLAVLNFQPPAEALPKAKAAALTAIEIDSDLAEAHGALAWVEWAYDWDWLGAEKEYKKAFELNPSSASSHLRYSLYLVSMGRFDEAMSEGQKAYKLDPLSPFATRTVGWVYLLARRYDEALTWYNKSVELEPNAGVLTRADIAWTYALKGAHTEAMAEYGKLPRRANPAEDQAIAGGSGFLLAISGRRREALDIIAQFKKLSESRYIDGCMVASVYAALGDKKRAFEWLNKAFEERSPSMAFLKVDPFFDNLRSDPRYPDLLRRVGLPQ
jgi:tetratricopeptide (TPR) repeat protein